MLFKQENEDQDDVNIIGQFGVGFYSAFMIANNVEVVSKELASDTAHKWESNGTDGYTISVAPKRKCWNNYYSSYKG